MNELSKKRKKYIPIKEVAEYTGTSNRQVYRNIQLPLFEECVKKFGTKTYRVDLDLYTEICQQVFR